jgi:hypothetical protein
MEMAERTELVHRAPTSVAVRRYEEQINRSQQRLRQAMSRLQTRAHELTPGARIASRPARWLLGAFAAGLALAWLTSRRRR